MKIKASELEGAALDWAAAKAVGADQIKIGIVGSAAFISCIFSGVWERNWRPSTDWSQGGPLIEKWRVMVEPLTHMDHPEAGWHAGFPSMIGVMHGPTALIAAMRAIVAAELGKEVDVPDELTEDDA